MLEIACPSCGHKPLDPPSGFRRPDHHCGACQRAVSAVDLVLAGRDELRAARSNARKIRGEFRDLARAVTRFLNGADKLFEKPPTEARGRALARLCNDLNLARDVALRFGLGGRP